MEATSPDCITDATWRRKHDEPGTSFRAPAICYPTSLEELIELCGTTRERMHAAGSHWGLSTAALSDHTFIETHDPANRHRAMARTLFDVIPGCMTDEFLDTMGLHHPVQFKHNTNDETPYFVHVETGKRVYELYAELDQNAEADPRSLASHLARTRGNHDYSGPWAFRTLGSAGGQTVFGALTTGTHGGDFDRPPIADDVAALHLVVAGGKHFWIEPAVQPEDLPLTDDAALKSVYAIDRYGGEENFEIVRDDKVFRAVLVGAHRFGVVYSIVLRAVRQYMLRETRVLGTWQNIRAFIADRNSWPYTVPPGNKFLQIVVSLTPFNGFSQNLVGISKRSNARWNPDSGPPLGRAARVGERRPDPDPLTGNPLFSEAGTSFPLNPDETNPSKTAAGTMLERACSNGNFLVGVIDAAIDDLTQFTENPGEPAPHDIIAVATVGGGDGLLALRDALRALAEVLRDLLGELGAGGGDLRFGQVLDGVRGALLGFPDPVVRRAGVFAWQLIVFKAFTAKQGPIDYTAISYAVMDTHDYRNLSCDVNVDSIEVFFKADDPMLIAFVDALIAFEIRQEFEGRAFVGYASLRFTGRTRALLGPQRWDRTCVVEVSGLKDVEGSTELIEFALALSRDRNFSGVLHWGQRNESNREDIEWRFGDPNDPRNGGLGRWREALQRINGDSSAFSSAFTVQTGLEPV